VTEPKLLRHNVVDLALHTLRDGDGATPPLLILHGLGERTADAAPAWTAGWAGPVHGLDFTGHGRSTVPVGGGYSAELLMGDADAALAHLGPCAVAGRGLGAYIALLIAGARPKLVRGAALLDGPGLTGGGNGPLFGSLLKIPPGPHAAPDPWALAELSRDVRPADYASSFARLALQVPDLRHPLVVAARVRPPWLDAVVDEPGVVEAASNAEAIRLLAA
jgi:pimeloyl-ACP methyl ester carboxylesterase